MDPNILKQLEQADAAAKATKAAAAVPAAAPRAPQPEPRESRPEAKVQPSKPQKSAAPAVRPATKVTRAGVKLSDEDLAGILLGAPPKAEPEVDPKFEADLKADLDLKKFYEKARTSVDAADAARSLGKSFQEYERQAVVQGVSLDDMVKQAQKGRSFEDYTKVAQNQIAFLPPEEREAKYAEQARKYEQAERGEIDLEEMKLAPAEESGIFKGYEVGGTKPEELPEAAKPGEPAYMTAERLIQTLSQRPDWVSRFDGYRNRAGGRYSAEWVNDAEKERLNKIDPADPEYAQKVADARRQAFVEMVAAKTIGFWAPPIFVKKEELESGEVPGLMSSMAPGNVEVVGFNKDGKILYRSESPLGYGLRLLDFVSVVPLPFVSKNAALPIPGQSAVVGLVTQGKNETWQEAAARGMKTSANWADYAMEESEGANPYVRGISMGLGLAGAMTHPDAFTGAAVGYTKAKGALRGYQGRKFAKAADPLLTEAAKALQAQDYDAVRENLAKFRTLSQEYSPGGKTNYSDLLARADGAFIEAITLADPSVKSLDPRLSEKLLGVLGDAPEVRDLIGRLAVVGDPHLHFSRSSREAAASLGKKVDEATAGAGATFETYLNAGNYGRRRELIEQAKRLYELNAPRTATEAATRTVDGKILALETAADARVKMDVPDAARDAAFEQEMARILRKHRDGILAGDKSVFRAIDEDMANSTVIGRGVTGDDGKAAEQFRLEYHSLELPKLRGRVSSTLASDIAKSHQEALQLFDQAISSAKANEASLGMAIEYMRRQIGRQTGVTITPRDVQYDALPFAEKVGELSPPAYATFARYRQQYPNVDPMSAWAEIRLVDQTYLAKAEREGKSIYDIWADSKFEFAPVKGAPKKGGKPPATPTTVAPPGTTAATTVAAAAAGGGKVVHPMVLDVASAIKADSGLDIPADRVDAVLKAVDKLGPGEQLKRPPFVSNAQFGAVAQELVRRDLLTTTDGKVFTKPEALVPTEAAVAAKAATPATTAAPTPAPAPAPATAAEATPAADTVKDRLQGYIIARLEDGRTVIGRPVAGRLVDPHVYPEGLSSSDLYAAFLRDKQAAGFTPDLAKKPVDLADAVPGGRLDLDLLSRMQKEAAPAPAPAAAVPAAAPVAEAAAPVAPPTPAAPPVDVAALRELADRLGVTKQAELTRGRPLADAELVNMAEGLRDLEARRRETEALRAAAAARLERAVESRRAEGAQRAEVFQRGPETPAAPAAVTAPAPAAAAGRRVKAPSLAELEAQAEASRRYREGLKAEAPKAPAALTPAPTPTPATDLVDTWRSATAADVVTVAGLVRSFEAAPGVGSVKVLPESSIVVVERGGRHYGFPSQKDFELVEADFDSTLAPVRFSEVRGVVRPAEYSADGKLIQRGLVDIDGVPRKAAEGPAPEAPAAPPVAAKVEAPAQVVEAPKVEPVVEAPVFERTFERTVEPAAEAPAEPAFQRAAEPEAAVPVARKAKGFNDKNGRNAGIYEVEIGGQTRRFFRDTKEGPLGAVWMEDVPGSADMPFTFLGNTKDDAIKALQSKYAEEAAPVARVAEEAPAAAPEAIKAEEVAAPAQPTGITPAAEAPVVREEIPSTHTEALDRIRGLTHQVEVPTFAKADPNVPERIRLGSARVFGTLDAEGRFVPQASVRWAEASTPPTLETITRELYREARAADIAQAEARALIDAAGGAPEPRPFKGEMYAERADKLEDKFGSATTFRSIYKSLATPPPTPVAVTAKVAAPRAMTAQRLNGALNDLYYGRMSPRQFVSEVEQVADKAADAFVARKINRETSQLVRGADMARERLINARRRRLIPEETASFALWLLDKNPLLADDLSVLVKETRTSKGGAAVAGEYKPLDRVVQLFSAPDLPSNTAVHEILHHTETMMPLAIQKGITREWAKSVMLAMADAATPDERRLLGLMFMQDPQYADEIFRGFESGVLSPSKHYQLVNPSEFWAVNAADILAGRRAAEAARGVSGWAVKAKQWLSEFVQKARATFNLTSQAPIIRGLDEVLRGSGTPINNMLTRGDVFYAVKSEDEAAAAAKASADAKVAADAAAPPPMLSRDELLDEVRASEAVLKNARDMRSGSAIISQAEADLAAARAKLADFDRELDESAEAAASMEAAIDETRAAAEAGRPVPAAPAAAEMRRVILVNDEPGSIIRAAVRYLTDEALSADDVLELARIARSRGVNVSAEYGRFIGSEEDVAKAYEVVADAFVDYLRTSKSPPTSQGALFDYMRDVFARTYKSTLAGPGGDAVSSRVRAAFDRLLPATPLKPKNVFEDAYTQLTTRDPMSRGALRALSDEARRRGIGDATVEKLKEILTAKVAEARRRNVTSVRNVLSDVLAGDTELIEFPVPVLGREKWTVNDLAALQERIDTDARSLARANDLQFDVLGRPVETTITEKLYSYVGGLVRSDDNVAKTAGKSVVAMNVYAFLGGSVVNTTEGMRALSPELRRDIETLARHTMNVVGDAGALLTEAVDSGDMRPFIGYLSGQNIEFTGVTERGAGRRVLTSGTEYTTGFLDLFRNVWDSLDEKERKVLTRMTGALNSKFKDFDPKLLERLRDLREQYDASKVSGVALSESQLAELKSLEAQYADHMVNFRQPSEAVVAMMFPEKTAYLDKSVVDKLRREEQQLLDSALNKVLGVKSDNAETVASSLGTAIGDILGRGGERSINDFRMVESLLYVAGKTERNGNLFDGTVFQATETLLRDTARIVGGTGRTAQAGDEAARRLGVLIAGFGSAVFGKLEMVGLRATLTEAEFRAFSAWSLGREISPEMRGQLARVAERFGLNTDFVQETMLGADVYIPSAARKMILDSVARSVYRDLTTVGLAGEAMRAALIATKKRMTRGNLVLRPRYFNVNTVDHFFQMNLIAGARVGAASAARLAFQTLMTTRAGNLFALLIDRPANAVLRFTKRVLRAEGVNKVITGAAAAEEFLPATLPVAEKLRDALSFVSDYVAQLMSLSKYRIEVNKVLDGRDEVFVVGERAYNARRVREIFSGEGVFSAWDTRRIGSAIRREGVMSVNEAGQLVRISYAKGGETSTSFGGTVLTIANAVDDFLLGAPRNAVDDLADAWAERERVGAAITLMEAGMDPRVAARVVIDALYDYGQSMTEADRGFLVQVIFPFWAFQKNSNGQFINSLFSPRTAYRMQMWLKFRYRVTDMITQLMYNDAGGELGIDVESMPVEAQQLYYAIMTKAHEHYGPVLPANVALGLRMILTGDPTDIARGQEFQIDADLAAGLGEILGPQSQSAQMLFARYRMTPPSKAGLPSFLRDRPGIGITRRRTAYTALYLSMTDDAETFTWYAVPESSIESSYKFAAHQMFVQLSLVEAAMALVKKDIPMSPEVALNLIRPIVDIERSPVVGSSVSLYSGQGYPQRLHPMVAAQLESMGFDLIRVPAANDPFADGTLLTRVEDAQAQAAAKGEGFDPTQLLGEDRLRKIRELNDSDLQPSELVGTRYYLPPGTPSLVFENSGVVSHGVFNLIGAAAGAAVSDDTLGGALTLSGAGQLYEINRLLLDYDERPDEREDIYGKLRYIARFYAGADIYQVSPDKTAAREEPMFTKKTAQPQ